MLQPSHARFVAIRMYAALPAVQAALLTWAATAAPVCLPQGQLTRVRSAPAASGVLLAELAAGGDAAQEQQVRPAGARDRLCPLV
jgi:hypothetical protein